MASVFSINSDDIAFQPKPEKGFGNVSAEEFGSILAQKAKTTYKQFGTTSTAASSTISDSLKKVGRYGISADNLELSGYLKPGTTERFLTDSSSLTQVLNSSSVWTGKGGINTVDDFLGNDILQTDIQTEIYSNAFDGLKGNNILTGLESSDIAGSITNVAADFGVSNTSDWINNDIADAAMGLDMDMLARGGLLGTDFASSKAGGLLGDSFTSIQDQLTSTIDSLASNKLSKIASSVGGIDIVEGANGELLGGSVEGLTSALGNLTGINIQTPGAFTNMFGSAVKMANKKIQVPPTVTPKAVTQTINRAEIDAAMVALVNNAKVSLPNYTGIVDANKFNLPSLSGLTNLSDNIAQQIGNGAPVEVCRCIGADELIAPTQAECEAAGGTWQCRTVNTTIEI